MTGCPRKFGRYGVCGAVLEMTTVDGRLVERCPACDRFARGLCRDCPRPVAGKIGWSRRCAVHTAAQRTAECARYRARNREAVNRREKLRMRQPAVLARNVALLRTWRKANPAKVRAQITRRIIRQVRAARRVA